MSIKNKLAAITCGLALAGTVAAPVAALAVGNTGTTEVNVQTSQDVQLKFSVATQINFAANGEGDLIAPSADATKIVNKSPFPIHVTNMTVNPGDGWTLTQDATHASGKNAIQFSVKPNDGAKVDAVGSVNLGSDWNLGYAGSSTDTLELTTEGCIRNVTKDISKGDKAASITWTFASGQAE